MAQVILAERLAPTPADARGLDRLLPAPQQVATFVGIEARDIRRLAREFAASQGGLAVAGGMSTHYGSGAHVLVGAGNLLNYVARSEEHTSELQSLAYIVCRLLL